MRILVTGARAPVALDLMRRFHQNGTDVVAADCCKFPIGRFSRMRNRFLQYPSPTSDFDLFQTWFLQRTIQEGIDLIIPTCEEVFYLAQLPNAVSARLFAPRLPLLRDLHNKWTFSSLIRNADLGAPETHHVESSEELKRFSNLDSDWVFKPIYSRFASRTLIKPSLEKLKTISPSRTDPWVAQHFIRGSEFSTYSVAQDGRLTAHATYHSPRRFGPGAGVLFQAVRHERILEQVRQFLAKVQFSGQIGFDLIEDEHANVWFLEANPRATSGLHLFGPDSGLCEAICESTCISEIEPDLRPRQVRFAVALGALSQLGSPKECFRWAQDFFSAKDVIWSSRDPLPFLCGSISLSEVMISAVRNRISFQQATTQDIEWNG